MLDEPMIVDSNSSDTCDPKTPIMEKQTQEESYGDGVYSFHGSEESHDNCVHMFDDTTAVSMIQSVFVWGQDSVKNRASIHLTLPI